MDMNKTVFLNSDLGRKLDKFKKEEKSYLMVEGKKISLVSKISLGRDKTNSVVIGDNMVSQFHALIQKIKKDYFIKDLDSTNGTFVNNGKVPTGKYIKLQVDDVIRIGRTELSFTIVSD